MLQPVGGTSWIWRNLSDFELRIPLELIAELRFRNGPCLTLCLQRVALLRSGAVMRQSLRETFRTKRREVAPGRSKEDNILEIQHGTAICILVKNAKDKSKGWRR